MQISPELYPENLCREGDNVSEIVSQPKQSCVQSLWPHFIYRNRFINLCYIILGNPNENGNFTYLQADEK
jgi:hypothetical protein